MSKKQSIGALFATDPAKERDGVVIAYGANLRVRIARAGGANDRFLKVAEEKTRAYRRMIQAESLPPELDKQLAREIFAEGVVLDWSEAYDDAGNEIPFTIENVVDQFEKYPEFFQFVSDESKRLANFRKAMLENDAGN